jgi:Purple acid Phosphatase, N-terminal domain
MRASLSLILIFSSAVLAGRPVSKVHLTMNDDRSKMSVQWRSDLGDILGQGTSTVQYGLSPRNLDNSNLGYNWTFMDPTTLRNYTMNIATMTGLVPGTSYFYRVGDPLDGWSPIFSFQATRTSFDEANPLKIAWYGDMGWTNAQALPYLQTDAYMYDVMLHVGGT